MLLGVGSNVGNVGTKKENHRKREGVSINLSEPQSLTTLLYARTSVTSKKSVLWVRKKKPFQGEQAAPTTRTGLFGGISGGAPRAPYLGGQSRNHKLNQRWYRTSWPSCRYV